MVLLVAMSLLAATPSQADSVDSSEETRSPTPFDGVDDLLYGTLFGGVSIEEDCYIDVDASGNMYIAGTTMSYDFPTTVGAFDVSPNGNRDVFAMKVSADGGTVVFSTLIGGNRSDWCHGMVVDDKGSMYIAGATTSMNFPSTSGAFCTTKPASDPDGFIVKLEPSGSSLMYSTFLGSWGREEIWDIYVDAAGNALVTGHTDSGGFPTTPGAFDRTLDRQDCFVSKIGPSGDSVIFSTLVGGAGWEWGTTIVVGPQGHPSVAGYTTSTSGFPFSKDAFSTKNNGSREGFVVTLEPDGSDIVISTLIGGSVSDYILDMAIDQSGAFYLVGMTRGRGFPTTEGTYHPYIDTHKGGNGPFGFVTKMAANGSALEFSTYIQNRYAVGECYPTDVAVDSAGDIYVVGFTYYGKLPTNSEAFDNVPGFGDDAFFMKLHSTGSRMMYSTYLGGDGDDVCDSMTLASDGTVYLSGTTYSSNFPTTHANLSRTLAGSSDLFAVRLDPKDTDGSVPGPVANLTVSVMSNIWVTWNSTSGQLKDPVTGYRVYRRPAFASVPYKYVIVGQEIVKDNDVDIGIAYEYTVVGVNDIGPGIPAKVTAIPWWPPTAPLNLTAVAGCTTVYLEWSLPERTGGLPILGYFIYRGTMIENIIKIGGVGNITEYVDTNVTGNRVYHYYVRAFHAMSSGPPSKTVSVLPYGLPGPPENFVVSPGDSQMVLEWDQPYTDGGHPITSYTIYRGSTIDDLVILVTLGVDVRMYIDLHLVNGADYLYMVVANNIVGEGPGSEVLYRVPRGPPGPPIGFHVTSSNGKIDISWKPPNWDGGALVNMYRIYRGLEPELLKVYKTVGSTITEFTDTNVANGYTFYYAIQAVSSVGGGELSSMVSAVPFGPPTWPMTIVVEAGMNKLVLKWTPPKDDGGFPVKEYEIYRGKGRQLVESLVVVDGEMNEYVDTDVKVGVVYYYRIIVLTARASSSPSWVVAGSPYGAPTVPKGITLIQDFGRVIISWGTPVHDGGFLLAGYHVYMKVDKDGAIWSRLATVTEGTNHVERGLINGRTYTFKVTAFNDVAEGSGIEANLTIVGRPEPPVDLRATVAFGRVYLEWSPPQFDGGSPITVYEVRRSDGAGATYLLGRVRHETSFVDEFAEPGVLYNYTITASNIFGDSERTEPVTAKVTEQVTPEFNPGSTKGTLVLMAVAVTLTMGYLWYRRRGRLGTASETGPEGVGSRGIQSRIVSLLRR
jgi:fibronectin type 3 domain-containing protein